MSDKAKNSRRPSVRLTEAAATDLIRLLEHFREPIPATPSEVIRLALRRLVETELDGPRKSRK